MPDILRRWILDICVFDIDSKITLKEIYTTFQDYKNFPNYLKDYDELLDYVFKILQTYIDRYGEKCFVYSYDLECKPKKDTKCYGKINSVRFTSRPAGLPSDQISSTDK